MKLNQKIPCIKVKSPIKVNKYNLENWQGMWKSKSTSRQKIKGYKTVTNLFPDSPYPDLASCGNQSVELR